MNIYEITGQIMELMLLAEDGIIDRKTAEDTMEGLELEFEQKAEAYAKVIETLKGDIKSLEEQIGRMERRKKNLEGNIRMLRNVLERSMKETGKTRFRTALFGFAIQKNAPSLHVTDMSRVPETFLKPQEPRLDRKAALDYIKENGSTGWAEIRQSESLRIR